MAVTRKVTKTASKPAPKASKAPSHKPSVSKKQKKSEKTIQKSKKPSKAPTSKTQKTAASKPVPKPKPAPSPPKQVPVSKRPQKEQKKPSGSSYIGYTTDQYNKFVEFREKLRELSNAELKELCKKNGQKVTGTKDELVERVADGKVLGAIPKCTSCGGGRPKWDAKTGTYKCPGYMEDSDFVNCKKKYMASEISRSPWSD